MDAAHVEVHDLGGGRVRRRGGGGGGFAESRLWGAEVQMLSYITIKVKVCHKTPGENVSGSKFWLPTVVECGILDDGSGDVVRGAGGRHDGGGGGQGQGTNHS